MINIRQTEFYNKWFNDLKDKAAKMRIIARIRRLSLGNAGDSKSVGNGVSELRIDFGPGYRIYYVKKQMLTVILLAGGDKSTQTKDIKKAIEIADRLED